MTRLEVEDLCDGLYICPNDYTQDNIANDAETLIEDNWRKLRMAAIAK
jgi:hypothetical protein